MVRNLGYYRDLKDGLGQASVGVGVRIRVYPDLTDGLGQASVGVGVRNLGCCPDLEDGHGHEVVSPARRDLHPVASSRQWDPVERPLRGGRHRRRDDVLDDDPAVLEVKVDRWLGGNDGQHHLPATETQPGFAKSSEISEIHIYRKAFERSSPLISKRFTLKSTPALYY